MFLHILLFVFARKSASDEGLKLWTITLSHWYHEYVKGNNFLQADLNIITSQKGTYLVCFFQYFYLAWVKINFSRPEDTTNNCLTMNIKGKCKSKRQWRIQQSWIGGLERTLHHVFYVSHPYTSCLLIQACWKGWRRFLQDKTTHVTNQVA